MSAIENTKSLGRVYIKSLDVDGVSSRLAFVEAPFPLPRSGLFYACPAFAVGEAGYAGKLKLFRNGKIKALDEFASRGKSRWAARISVHIADQL